MGEAIDRLQERAVGLEGKVMIDGSQFVVNKGIIKRVVWAGAVEPILMAYSRDCRITEITADLLGSVTAHHLINQVHFKLPGNGVSFPWHQDSTHRRYGTPQWIDVNGKGSYVQTAITIDKSTPENGPLQFIPESCKLGHLGLAYRDKHIDLSRFDLREPQAILAEPGDVIVFHPFTIHGSDANESEKPRRLFINGFAYPGANKREYPGCGIGELIDLLPIER